MIAHQDVHCYGCGEMVPAEVAYRDGIGTPFHWNEQGGGHTTEAEAYSPEERKGTPGLELRIEPVKYEVTNYPEGGVNAREFTLWVERRDVDRWAVTDGVYCYRKDGHKSYEMNPSSRTDRFKKAYRFPLDQALEIAMKIVPTLRLGAGPNHPGKTAEEVWEWEQKQ